MIYGSVCSGIEAASVAWHPLGWRAAFLSEIEDFPRAVLKHHYPKVPLRGDFTEIKEGEHAAIDVLVGGTPCQAFSIAGLRRGLADDRGNLALEYLRLAERLRPRWIVWENVPGVLSTVSHTAPDPCEPPPPLDMGCDGAEVETTDDYDAEELHAFHCFLAGVAECGYGFAYRILDAQHFGLAQRRKRVFVVGYLGDWRRAAAVLFEPASLRGHPSPSREKGKGVAKCLTHGSGSGQRYDGETETFVTGVANTLRTPSHGATWRGDGADNFVTHALRADGFDASEDGTGRGTPLVPISFPWQVGGNMQMSHDVDMCGSLIKNQTHAVAFAIQERAVSENLESGPQGAGFQADVGYTLEARQHVQSVAFSIMPQNSGKDYKARAVDVAQPLMAGGPVGGNQGGDYIANRSAVRRLTPRECERLQGFPDDYTLIPWRNGMAADGPRYKALGNSMAVPVMRWIGARIAKVDAQ